jgi:hypothetical protein
MNKQHFLVRQATMHRLRRHAWLALFVLIAGCETAPTAPRDAEQALRKALSSAKQQDKTVLVHLSGPG